MNQFNVLNPLAMGHMTNDGTAWMYRPAPWPHCPLDHCFHRAGTDRYVLWLCCKCPEMKGPDNETV